MNKKYIMALDQGTTSSRCIIFDKNGNIISLAQKEYKQIFPLPSYVEHDPLEIWQTQLTVAKEALEKSGIGANEIDSIGITNQRETTVVWDKYTGRPIYNAIVWQCRRTAEYCDRLKQEGYTDIIKNKTGLVIDAYFSGTKIKWILDSVKGAREKAEKGELLFGTVDTWLLWNLTEGRVHATDYSNASRTMLYNINELAWDKELLELLDIPESMLPAVCPSSGIFGTTSLFGLTTDIPISGIAGDQQAALFGQTCFDEGQAKNTYGTGCFLLLNTAGKPHINNDGLVSTIAWGIDGKVTYALEGSVFVGGAVIQWLRDQMQFISSAADSELEASKVQDNAGVYIVPAFTGLGAPYWDQYAKGTVTGLTRGTNKSHIVRAGLESIAYQSHDILRAMERSAGIRMQSLNVDGGACANDLLMQFQADILGVEINRPACIESTALGAAYLAGLATGYYKNTDEIKALKSIAKKFTPVMDSELKDKYLKGWRDAVSRTLTNEKN
ncbi:MAG: glycerol kinase GlpK [Ruminococcaceae bacterium]|nr:glycerol kinase GlpK [Oscillospiraceae bacterium]